MGAVSLDVRGIGNVTRGESVSRVGYRGIVGGDNVVLEVLMRRPDSRVQHSHGDGLIRLHKVPRLRDLCVLESLVVGGAGARGAQIRIIGELREAQRVIHVIRLRVGVVGLRLQSDALKL